jgi:hypothetical protein
LEALPVVGLVCWSFPLVLEALPLHRVKRARKPSKAVLLICRQYSYNIGLSAA